MVKLPCSKRVIPFRARVAITIKPAPCLYATAAIVGARRPAHVDGWLPAAELELGEGELSAIDRALEDTGARLAAPAAPGAR